MKIAIILAILLLNICSSCTGRVSLALDVRIKVIDQDGTPVKGATVDVGFLGLGISDEIDKGKTDAEGVYVAHGKSNYEYRVRVQKIGYYETNTGRRSVKNEVVPRKWEIVDQDIVLILRKIKNPIAMYTRQRQFINVPAYNTPIGYDMEKGDWVAPYGKGAVSDLIFKLTGYFNDFYDKDVTLTLSFTNPGDGIIVVDPVRESEFKSPYEAPQEGYADSRKWRLYKHEKAEGLGTDRWDQCDESRFESQKVYLLRLRTVLDENGGVKEAYYGKICDGIIFEGNIGDAPYNTLSIHYSYLNPTVNDRNLEYAIGHSLIKNLKSDQYTQHP